MVVFKVIAAILVLVVGGLLVAAMVGSKVWDEATADRIERLYASGSAGTPLDVGDLPDPVRRYLSLVRPDPSVGIVRARLVQEGEFKLGDEPDSWRPFSAMETFRAGDPGFVWDARIRMAPGVDVRVRDYYVDGDAGMVGRILGVFTVVDVAHSAALAEGALARYLAEAVWLPTRLAAGPGLRWEAVDEGTAVAHLNDGDTRARLQFSFNAEGDPVEVRGVRPRETDGDFEPTEWVGRFSHHREMGGFRIPAYGEVAWIVDGAESLYWKGTIRAADFEVVPLRP